MSPGAFRFLLATIVVASHFTSANIGVASVYLFFALSGYWVSEMWSRKYSKTRSPYVTYLISRVWRIAPVFLLCSMLALFLLLRAPGIVSPVIPFDPIEPNSIIPSFILLGYSALHTGPLGPAWSLDVEMQFYIIAPILIAVFPRRPVLTALAIIALALVSAAIWKARSIGCTLPFFLAGIACARMPALRPSSVIAKASAGLFCGALGLFAIVPALRPVMFTGAHPGAMSAFNPALNVLLGTLALPFALHSVSRHGGNIDRLMSDWSYSLYLFHWIPLVFVQHYLPGINQHGHLVRGLLTLPVLAATYAISLAITTWLDRPLNSLRAEFVRRRRLNRVAAAAGTA
ncbi:acyltransferase [Burkholderia sp. SCN-KJ]|uniref:acyltransferase family protein n=1 Tax=Burkholderia sp. SCN-KJ TaxID=2969248 RepID=UPI00214FA5E1|nr:acyltransferase [Burkholderia sp. SCN-KJ]MCR4469384.1 acyltransferase [Burkholderia sp. SCN-KJ]